MSYITTVSGKHFDPHEAQLSDIDLYDIGHALSLMCRANGHVKYFFTVGQHSLNCCYEAKARGYSTNLQLACLLHDAAEAYICDLTRPIKETMTEYKQVEESLLSLIWEKYLLRNLTDEEKKMVFEIDDDMLSFEFWKLMPEVISDRYLYILSSPDIECRNPLEVEKEFLELCDSLM